MKRREFFQHLGAGGVLKDPERLELACDLLQVHYAQALLENRVSEFFEDLKQQMAAAGTIVVRKEGLLRGGIQQLFQNLFAEYEAKGKRFERKRL
ncbi:MAG: hypothetical protein HYX74_06760 [Acidobacteria bacterium]|nr:hypothetical protein [Acidobacteriota bacterium]